MLTPGATSSANPLHEDHGVELAGSSKRRATRLGSVERSFNRGKERKQGFLTELFPHSATAHFVGYSPGDSAFKTFCSGGEGGQLVLYDAGHNELISRWTGLQMKFTQEKKKEQVGLDSIIKIRSMCYTHDGKLLCLGGMDGTMSIFDLNPYKEHGEIHNVLISKRIHTKRITAIACNPNSTPEKTTLITCSDDEQIVKWTFTASGEDNYELTGQSLKLQASSERGKRKNACGKYKKNKEVFEDRVAKFQLAKRGGLWVRPSWVERPSK
ncbi:hypothetical protein TL16_g05327 [Triparma laevis f. inornata]|uniref:Uncharacterized protein n=2 Tax=Triparma laevis TaxID=1534972 RepID=A0A9W7FPB1_9STRA|nr:hypothetical protein TL16_g05327 [Triparma laevis f. inornata]GMI15640.1 hypothetical protein TrLO_g15184 [Triparma laevis f. longispina]